MRGDLAGERFSDFHLSSCSLNQQEGLADNRSSGKGKLTRGLGLLFTVPTRSWSSWTVFGGQGWEGEARYGAENVLRTGGG